MKKLISVSVIVIFIVMLSSTCELTSNSLSGDTGDTEGFIVHIQGISLSMTELGTIPGRNPELKAIINPPFATQKELEWTSSNSAVATVNSLGEINIEITQLSSTQGSRTTVIKVKSVDDPSLYAECLLTVYPNDYPTSRSWAFPSHPTGGANNSAISPDSDGDYNYKNGMWLLLSSGSASEYNAGPAGQGFYKIDPDNPYEYGPNLTNGSRSMNWGDANWPSGGNATRLPGWTVGHIRTGSHSRAMKIAALKGPFTLMVNYIHNGTAGSHADIRIGDTAGFRVQGAPSDGSRVDTDLDVYNRTVYYVYPSEDIVPLIFVETNGNVRIYDVIVFNTADNPKYPVRTKVIDGETYQY
jgi:hypothetical protein